MTKITELTNTYYVMRHGLSVPNTKNIIISHPVNGTMQEHGLAEEGVRQSERSAKRSGLAMDTVIVSSDFSRAHQTAEVLRRTIGAGEVIIDERLRERHFGDMEFGDGALYDEVWAHDIQSPFHTHRGVESLDRVVARQLELLAELETKHSERVIVLVSHGDPINILMTALSGQDVRHHRRFTPIDNAQILPIMAARPDLQL